MLHHPTQARSVGPGLTPIREDLYMLDISQHETSPASFKTCWFPSECSVADWHLLCWMTYHNRAVCQTAGSQEDFWMNQWINNLLSCPVHLTAVLQSPEQLTSPRRISALYSWLCLLSAVPYHCYITWGQENPAGHLCHVTARSDKQTDTHYSYHYAIN